MKREKEKIDVLFLGRFADNEILSGPEKTARRIFSEHTKLYRSCFIQYFFDGGKYGYFKKIFGRENPNTVNGSPIMTLGLFKIIFEILKRRPALIHIITYERFAVLAIICKLLCNSKIIYNVHGVIAYENHKLKKISSILKLKDKICERMFFKYSNVLIFYSENSIDIAEKYYKIDESKAVILSGGIDETFFNNNFIPNARNGRLKIVIQYLNVLRKSSAEFLRDALNKLSAEIDLYVIGTNDGTFSEVNPKIKVNHIVKLNNKQLAAFYEDKHIFLSLNKYDTFSVSTAEAMASGLVPIVSEETGISRYIENGENGFVVKFNDTQKLAQILDYLDNDRGMIGEISSKAKLISGMLSWHDVYDTYSNIYKSTAK